MPSWNNQRGPDLVEKVISGLCYLSFGLIGLLYIIVSGKSANSDFFRFHFMQAIVLGILGVLLGWTAQSMTSILGGIFGLFGPAGGSAWSYVGPGIGLVAGIVEKLGLGLFLYGSIFAFLGKYAEIPFLSKMVRQRMF